MVDEHVLPHFDFRAMSRTVLGRYRGGSPIPVCPPLHGACWRPPPDRPVGSSSGLGWSTLSLATLFTWPPPPQRWTSCRVVGRCSAWGREELVPRGSGQVG